MTKNAQTAIQVGQHSEAGVKGLNDDACGVHIPEEPALSLKGICTVIADGVSQSEGGREASETCVRGFLGDYYSTPDSWTVKTSGQKVLGAINRWLYSQSQKAYDTERAMLSTFSAMVFKSSTVHLFHIGDSRIYRLRDKDLEPLTHDHRILASGSKTYLGRAMGAELTLDIDYKSVPVEVGDMYALMTDGIYEFVPGQTIKKLLQEYKSNPDKAAKAIVARALENGSDDNVTCQVIRVDHLPHLNEEDFYQHLTELPFPPELEPGMTIDGYRVTRELHASSRTQIYVAQDTDTGQKVILKTPSVNYSDDPAYLDQFLHEEWVGRRINNDHVLKIIDTQRRRRFLYYTTEYIDGESLREWMNAHAKPELEDVRNIIEQIAAGLRHFHRLEMVHRDLKPENIMLDKQGKAIIIDFGSTRIAGTEESHTPYEKNNILGTMDFAAPEYFQGFSGSNRSDIYALGVIVYQMLTGSKLPYGNALKASNLKRVRYTSVKHYAPEIPLWMDMAIQKSVNLDPEKRYERLSEFVHDLSQPNTEFANQKYTPYIERNPVGFWRTTAVVMLILNLILLFFYIKS